MDDEAVDAGSSGHYLLEVAQFSETCHRQPHNKFLKMDSIPRELQLALAALGGCYVISKILSFVAFLTNALLVPGTDVSFLPTDATETWLD